MKSRLLARRYATAFIAKADENSYEILLSERKDLQKVFYENEHLLNFLRSRFVSVKDKKELIKATVDHSDYKELWLGLFNTILQKKREKIISAILYEIERILLIKLNKLKMIILFAREQKQETIDKIKKHYEKMMGKTIIVEIEIMPEIIGGFIAKIGNTRIDGSIKHTLDMFRKTKTVKAGI